MMMTRLFASVAVIGTMATMAHAQECTPAHTFPTVEAGKLTVAIYEYPPFSTVTADGQIGGVDSDIVKAIAKANCLEIVPVSV